MQVPQLCDASPLESSDVGCKICLVAKAIPYSREPRQEGFLVMRGPRFRYLKRPEISGLVASGSTLDSKKGRLDCSAQRCRRTVVDNTVELA